MPWLADGGFKLVPVRNGFVSEQCRTSEMECPPVAAHLCFAPTGGPNHGTPARGVQTAGENPQTNVQAWGGTPGLEA